MRVLRVPLKFLWVEWLRYCNSLFFENTMLRNFTRIWYSLAFPIIMDLRIIERFQVST